MLMNLFDLYQYFKRIKSSNNSLDRNRYTKLTVEEQMQIEIGGGGSGQYIDLAVSDVQDTINAGNLVPGAFYVIDGADQWLYGGTRIVLQAVAVDKLSEKGFGCFYNPKYDNHEIFDSSHSYGVGDYVIWGGYTWRNLNETTGNSTDQFNLDENWLKVPYDDEDTLNAYNKAWDQIEYDVNFDYIISRYEETSGNFVTNTVATNFWFWCDIRAIRVFRWGNPWFGQGGVMGCKIVDSYFNCLNFKSGSIRGVKMSNYCYIHDLEILNTGYLEAIELDNYSLMINVTIDNSGLYGISLDNNSVIDGLSLNNAHVYNINASNECAIINCNLTGGGFQDIVLTNNCHMGWLSTMNGNISSLNMTNFSVLGDCEFNNVNMYNNSLDGSYVGGLSVTNSYFEFIYMKDSGFQNLTTDSSNFINVDMKGHSLQMGNQNNIQINAAEFSFNTIKYQFLKYFDGSTGYGEPGPVVIPFLFVPQGWYIEKVLLEQNGGMSGNADSTFNLGFSAGTGAEGINDANGLKPDLDNKVSCFDISNGKASGTLSSQACVISASVKNNPFAGGGVMAFEITLKSTNYSSNND